MMRQTLIKPLLLLFFSLGILSSGYAQEEKVYVFRLQDGSELRGAVLSETEEAILLKVVSGQEIWVSNEDLLYNGQTKEKFSKKGGESASTRKKSIPFPNDQAAFAVATGTSLFQRGSSFFGTIGMGYALEGLLFYPLADGLATAGIGTGLHHYYFAGGELVVPVMLDLKARFGGSRKGAYFNMAGGYGFGIPKAKVGVEAASGGFFASAAIGGFYSILDERVGFWDIGYRWQEASFLVNPPNGGDIKDKAIRYNRIHFRVGIVLGKY